MKKLVIVLSSLFLLLVGCQQEMEPKKKLTIYEASTEPTIYPDEQFISDEKEKEFFISLYQGALQSYEWFTFSTMEVDMERPLVSSLQENQGFFAVKDKKFSTMQDLKDYLSKFFTSMMVEDLLNSTDLYKEFEQQLYAVTADRGSNLSKGNREIIKLIKQDETNYILRLEQDIVDTENRNNVIGIEIIDYPLTKMNDQWLFSGFTNPR